MHKSLQIFNLLISAISWMLLGIMITSLSRFSKREGHLLSTQGRSNCTWVREWMRSGNVAQEMFPVLALETVLLKERKDMMKRWLDIERKLQDPRWKKDQAVLPLLPPAHCPTAPPPWGGDHTWNVEPGHHTHYVQHGLPAATVQERPTPMFSLLLRLLWVM